MPYKKGKKPSKDILDILREASEENRAAMEVERSERKPEIEKTKVLEEDETSKKRTKVSKRINAETAEIIDKYSTRKIQSSMSDTQKLRKKLSEQKGNTDLLGYFGEDKSSAKSKRVEKLYDMINDARTRTLSDLEKKPPSSIDSSRFSDEAVSVQEEYTQEQMFPFGDTLHFDDPADEREVASYDSDYAKLTEKITNSELNFESDNQSEGQVSFVNDDNELLVEGEPLDETDLNLRLAFEMMEDEDGRLAKLAKENREKRRNEETKGL